MRNPGIALDMAWVASKRVNKSSTLRRAAELGTRRSVKKDFQAGWLLRGVTCIDLTTLDGGDTPGNVARMCAKAKNPVRKDTLKGMGADGYGITTGAVCVYPARVADAVAAVAGSGVGVASVATGFPAGQISHSHKLEEIKQCVADGATEIDIVITRTNVLTGNWGALYDEVASFRDACGPARMKSILATGDLATLTNVYKASMVAMMAGSDFIKTSTGKEKENATLPVSLTMVRAIREYHDATGYMVGFKPAGGISKAKDVLVYQSMMKEELGDQWLTNEWFRFGASSLLTDIERQLYHHVTQEYAAEHYMPMGGSVPGGY